MIDAEIHKAKTRRKGRENTQRIGLSVITDAVVKWAHLFVYLSLPLSLSLSLFCFFSLISFLAFLCFSLRSDFFSSSRTMMQQLKQKPRQQTTTNDHLVTTAICICNRLPGILNASNSREPSVKHIYKNKQGKYSICMP